MSPFVTNLVLALIWTAVTGSFTLVNFIFGFVLAAFTLFLLREKADTISYFQRALCIFMLLVLFLKELLNSALNVAKIVLSPKMELKPGIIAYEMKVDRDFEIMLLANLITLTPGTLSVDISDDRKRLFIHALDCADPDGICADIANGFERRIMEAFR